MNCLLAHVIQIESSGSFSLVDLEFGDLLLSAVIMETEEDIAWLRTNARVQVLFKETEVSIALEPLSAISLRNRFAGTIATINTGKIMSRVEISGDGYTIISVITTRSVKKLDLQPGQKVIALVKANELLLMQPDKE